MKLGKAIAISRRQKEMSQTELASICGISVSYLSLLEHEKRDPSFSVVQNIASGLNMPLYILMFLAIEKDELDDLLKTNLELAEKLSYIALRETK